MISRLCGGRPGFRVFALKFVLPLGAILLCGTGFGAPVRAAEEPVAPVAPALASLEDAFTSLADKLEPAVVTVVGVHAAPDDMMTMPGGMQVPGQGRMRRAVGSGSGVIIDKDGWVLTNDHVVSGADKVTVRLHDGREFIGAVRRDFRSDIALVKISSPTPFPVAALGDSEKTRVGQWAIAIGSPFRYEGSFSVGVISSLYRSQQISDGSPASRRFYPNMIQTDAAINPGNSGGPLCNIRGEVIGINTAIESDGGGSVGIGFAIPVNTAKFVISQLREKGSVSYGFLGVSPTSVPPKLALALSVDHGALIDMEPEKDTPAAKAGIHAGDVLTTINGKAIRNELDLRTLVSQTPPKTAVSIDLIREGKAQRVSALLTEAPALEAPAPPAVAANGHVILGITVEPLTPKAAEEMHLGAEIKGVIIHNIDPSSAAADNEDLRPGLVIVKVNDILTPNVQAFQTATAALKTGDQVRLLVQIGEARVLEVVSMD